MVMPIRVQSAYAFVIASTTGVHALGVVTPLLR
jgi:hypothetical protein